MRNDTCRSAFFFSFFLSLFYHHIKRHPCLNALVVVQVLQAFVVVVIHAQLLFHSRIKFVGLVHRFHQAGEKVLLFRPFGHLVVVAEVGFLDESVFYPLAS